MQLIRKHNVSYRYMLKFVKKTLGCERLTPGNPKQALESPFAQRWPEMFAAARESGGDGAAQFVKLVDAVLKRSFDGQFPFGPEYDADFAAALQHCFLILIPEFENQPQPVLDHFSHGLTEAVHTLRESRDAIWQN
jgi:hypothetical protein